jgi:hypothetical protein
MIKTVKAVSSFVIDSFIFPFEAIYIGLIKPNESEKIQKRALKIIDDIVKFSESFDK